MSSMRSKDSLFEELEDLTQVLDGLYQDLAVVEWAEIDTRSRALSSGLNQGAAVNATDRLAEVQSRDHRQEATKVRADIRSKQERRDFLRLCIEHGYHEPID